VLKANKSNQKYLWLFIKPNIEHDNYDAFDVVIYFTTSKFRLSVNKWIELSWVLLYFYLLLFLIKVFVRSFKIYKAIYWILYFVINITNIIVLNQWNPWLARYNNIKKDLCKSTTISKP
jgi:hypothetical protein